MSKAAPHSQQSRRQGDAGVDSERLGKHPNAKGKRMDDQGSNRFNTEGDMLSGLTVCKAQIKCVYVSSSRTVTTHDVETTSIPIFK